jgi:hypothetical protein
MPTAPQESGSKVARNKIIFMTQDMCYSAVIGDRLLGRTSALNVAFSHDSAHLLSELRYQPNEFVMRALRRIHPAKGCYKLWFVQHRLKSQIQVIGAAASEFLRVFDTRTTLIAILLRKSFKGFFNLVSP